MWARFLTNKLGDVRVGDTYTCEWISESWGLDGEQWREAEWKDRLVIRVGAGENEEQYRAAILKRYTTPDELLQSVREGKSRGKTIQMPAYLAALRRSDAFVDSIEYVHWLEPQEPEPWMTVLDCASLAVAGDGFGPLPCVAYTPGDIAAASTGEPKWSTAKSAVIAAAECAGRSVALQDVWDSAAKTAGWLGGGSVAGKVDCDFDWPGIWNSAMNCNWETCKLGKWGHCETDIWAPAWTDSWHYGWAMARYDLGDESPYVGEDCIVADEAGMAAALHASALLVADLGVDSTWLTRWWRAWELGYSPIEEEGDRLIVARIAK